MLNLFFISVLLLALLGGCKVVELKAPVDNTTHIPVNDQRTQ